MKIEVDNSTGLDSSIDITGSSNLVKFILVFTIFWFVPLILVGLVFICSSDYVVPLGEMGSAFNTVGELIPFAGLWALIGAVVMWRSCRKSAKNDVAQVVTDCT